MVPRTMSLILRHHDAEKVSNWTRSRMQMQNGIQSCRDRRWDTNEIFENKFSKAPFRPMAFLPVHTLNPDQNDM